MDHRALQDTTLTSETGFCRHDFGSDFRWGIATAAFQVEGATAHDGRGPSIWDTFTRKKGKIKNNDHADEACEFYHRYASDLELVKRLGFREFRFSISWSRIIPAGTGTVNPKGIGFYNRLINKCLELGIEPWVTLYHWDLPQALEDRGGWKNREVISWFQEYARVCAIEFGDRVKNWIVMNEPMAVAGLGYTTGLHAPGRKGLFNFFPVAHHLALGQSEAARVIRAFVPGARIGTALSCSPVEAASRSEKDLRAADRADALMNRLFIEPSLGLGYPTDVFPFLNTIYRYAKADDMEKLTFDFDFIGLQNYFRVVVRHSYLAPGLWLKEVPPTERSVPVTAMGWEVAPDGMYQILKQFDRYTGINELIISENGAAFHDSSENGRIKDNDRIAFFRNYLAHVLKAKREGVKIGGYLAWSLLDNFEWAEGYSPRFGLVHVNYQNQQRTVKDSGKWFADFLQK